MASEGLAQPRASIIDPALRAANRSRISGRSLLIALVGFAFLAIAWNLLLFVAGGSRAQTYRWDFGIVARYIPVLFSGLVLSIQLTIASIVMGMTLGLVVAMAQLAPSRTVRTVTTLYVELMRGTPALVQLIWVYYALPIMTGIQLPAIPAVILAFTLNLGAFYGEAFRSGIQAVPREQVEAGEVLGLSYIQRMRYVVVPQAFRIVLPVLISYAISLFKDTSLVSTLGVAELMYNGRSVATETYRPLEILTTVAAIYFLIAFPVTIVMRRVETYLGRHLAATR